MSSAAVAGPSTAPAAPALPPSVPVTIVTGFLGAGKTSLLNKIVKQFVEDKNIAVIENEFGEVNLDSKMVSNKLRSKEDLVSIHNGCVCCSLRKDILSALAELSRRSEQANRPYDNVVLETTGLADPAPVAFTFFANPWTKARYHLDSIVTVVDAKYLNRHLETGASVADIAPLHQHVEMPQEERAAAAVASAAKATAHDQTSPVNEVFNQIAFADIVLLNKIDLVSDEAAVAVERAIREINSLARVVHTRLNDDDCPNWLSTILDSKNFSLERALEVDQRFLESASSSDEEGCLSEGPSTSAGAAATQPENPDTGTPTQPQHDATAGPSNGPASARPEKRSASDMEQPARGKEEDADPVMVRKPRKLSRTLHDLVSVRSVCVLLPGELDTYLFNMFMRDFLQERGKDIFRSKGTLCVHGHKRTFNFQGVHETFQLAPCPDDGVDIQTNPHSEIVFIGRHLDKDAIKQGLLACLWRPLPPHWEEYLDKKTTRTYYVNSETNCKSWTRPVHPTPEGREEDEAAAAAAVVAGAERTLLSVSSVKQPAAVRPVKGAPVQPKT